MPSPPNGVIERLNYIKDFFFDPCDAPLTVYVETMLPALLEAAILWWAPVPEEIFIAWARPSKALGRYRSRRKGTRGSKAGRLSRLGPLGRIINFDTNEFIGKRLPGAELLGRGGINGLNWWLWRIFAFTQLLGLIWLIWEVISGFWAKWFSLLYETQYCQESARTVLSAYGAPYSISAVVPHNAFIALNIEKQRGPISWTINGGTAVGRDVTLAVAVTIEGTFDPGDWVQISIYDGTPTARTPLARSRFPLEISGIRTFALNHTFPEGGRMEVSLETNRGLLLISRTEAYVQGGPTE